MPSNSHTNTVNFGPTCRSTQNATRGAIFLRIADYSGPSQITQVTQPTNQNAKQVHVADAMRGKKERENSFERAMTTDFGFTFACMSHLSQSLWPWSNVELHMRRTKLQFELIQTGKAPGSNVELNWNDRPTPSNR